MRRPARDILPGELNAALVRAVEAAENVDECRFSGAVRTDEADDLSPPQLEVDTAESLNAVK
jgi:hypothetical protein